MNPAAPFLPHLDAAAFEALRTADEPAALRALREQALAELAARATPDRAQDDWRRTRPDSIPFDRIFPSPPLRASPGRRGHELDTFFDVVVRIAGGKAFIVDRSGVLKSSRIFITPVFQGLDGDADRLSRLWTLHPAPVPPDLLDAARRAFCTFALHIRVPDGVELERGVLIHHQPSADGLLYAPMILIEAGDGSAVSVTEFIDGSAAAVSLAGRNVWVGDRARVRLVQFQALGANASWLGRDHAVVGRDSTLDAVALHFGAGVVKTRTSAEAAGAGAHLQLGGLFFGALTQHFDQQTMQIHSAADTTSNLLYKGAVKDGAYSVYRGLIAAARGAVRIDAYQKNHNLVLNDGARADSLPGLLIDADDLKCSHGATIGTLDPEQLFYLRSRGLGETEARRLLLEGYFEEIVGRLSCPALRDAARRAIEVKIDPVS